MKHVSELMGSAMDHSQRSIESERPRGNNELGPVMNRLWLRMTEIYGHKFVSSYGDAPNESWCRCMADIAPEQIASGLNALLSRNESWPPTAIEFRQLCTGDDGHAWERQCHKVFEPVGPMLEDKTAKEQRCADGLAQIRALREATGL